MPGAADTIVRHDIDVVLTPGSGAIEIVDRVRPGNVGVYRFVLAPWLALEDLRVDGEPVPVSRDSHVYRVDLGDRVDPVLRFVLRGSIPPRSDAAVDGYSSSGEDGVFLPGYDAWVPRGERGFIDYRLEVRVPETARAVATGKLVEEETDAQGYRATFVAVAPGEAPSLFAGPYLVRQSAGPEPRLRSYFHAELEPLADVYLEAAAAYIARYAALIGAYPYADFHIVSAPLPVGLGFPNLTYVGRQVLPLPFMRTRSLAHEVLHNWWGNAVAVDYASGNWAEGLTTYQADYALAVDQGEDAARAMRVKWLRDYAALPVAREQSLREFVGKQHDAAQVIGYNKAAFLFHMLRLEIGQSAFDNGLRLFWQRHRFSTAGWDDLQAAFEKSSTRRLDWFFSQWLNRRGAPVLELGEHRIEPVEGGFRTRIELRQPDQVYRLTLPLRLISRDGSEAGRITTTTESRLLEFVTPTRPLALQIDPDSDVFRRLQADETPPILRDVTLHPDTLTLVVGDDPGFQQVGRELAQRMLDTPPRQVDLEQVAASEAPLLLIVETGKLEPVRQRLALAPPPGQVSVLSAGAWSTRRAGAGTALVVAARDLQSLRALLRPLPHYGGQSYVLFDGARAVERGVWPVAGGPLYREFD